MMSIDYFMGILTKLNTFSILILNIKQENDKITKIKLLGVVGWGVGVRKFSALARPGSATSSSC